MIKISCDSTADLSPELYERYNIAKLPLYINIAGREYMDGVDLTSEELFKLVDETGELPSTAAQSIDDFLKYLGGLREENPGAEIIHFTISSAFSTTYNVACLAAKEMEGVYIIDSRNLSSGIGQSVIEACEMAARGMEAAEIKRVIEEEIIPKVDTSFTLDTLKYMAKGGRCSTVAALGANLLQLKPCIETGYSLRAHTAAGSTSTLLTRRSPSSTTSRRSSLPKRPAPFLPTADRTRWACSSSANNLSQP